MKTTKIGIQQMKTNFQYKARDTNTTSQVTWIVNIIGVELGNLHLKIRVILMVFNATFNNISVISWWSILLVQETGVPGGNHRPAANNWQTVSHNVVFEYISSWSGFELITLVVLAFEPPDPWFSNIVQINKRHKHEDIRSSQSMSTCFVPNTDKSHIKQHNNFIMFIFYTTIWQQYDFIIFMYVGVICLFKTKNLRYPRTGGLLFSMLATSV